MRLLPNESACPLHRFLSHSVRLLWAALLLWGIIQTEQVRASQAIIHTPVTEAQSGEPLVISAQVTHADQIAQALLFVRPFGDPDYQRLPLDRQGDRWVGTIPAEWMRQELIEYYFTFQTRDGMLMSDPAETPDMLPHVVFIETEGVGRWIEILYPEPGMVIQEQRPQISAALTGNRSIADQIEVELDGAPITEQCELTEDYLLFQPEIDLAPGVHLVSVSLRPAEGGSSDESPLQEGWHFEIQPRSRFLSRPTGFASLLAQTNDASRDSNYLLYDPGSHLNATLQLQSAWREHPLNLWFNRSTFYQTKSTEASLSLLGEPLSLQLGSIFPRFSKLTLDTMPATGAELDLALNRWRVSTVVAKTDFLVGDDAFLTALLSNRFAGIHLEKQGAPGSFPFTPFLSLLYATDDASDATNQGLDVRRRDWLYAAGLRVGLPQQLQLSAEWGRDRKQSRYTWTDPESSGAESTTSVSEIEAGNAFLIELERAFSPLTFELSYQDSETSFAPETNPFWEGGKRGAAVSARYGKGGLLSGFLSYGGYIQEGNSSEDGDDTVTEGSLTVQLASERFPTLSISLDRQRVPYVGYSLQGGSVNLGYSVGPFQCVASASLTRANFWDSDTSRESRSLSGTLNYSFLGDRLIASLGYSGYSTRQREGESYVPLQNRRQIWFSLAYRFTPRNRLQTRSEQLQIEDGEDPNRDAVQRATQLEYDMSF